MALLAQIGKELPERYYLGIDIGYREHVAVVISLQVFLEAGERWKRTRTLAFESTRAGLKRLQKYLDRFSPDRQAFLGICEPTGGYYGAALYHYMLEQGYQMLLIENATTRHVREKIFGSTTKTDDMDARVMSRIAFLHEAVGEEFTLKPLRLPKPDDAELLILCRTAWKLNGMLTRAKNQFSQLMAVVFPELKVFFESSVARPVSVALMATYPSPAEIAAAPAQEVRTVLWEAKGYQHAKRVSELQALARESSGLLPDPTRAWRMNWLTHFLLMNFQAQNDIYKQIKRRLILHPGYDLLKPIPYTGLTTLGTILGATGEISRFRNYRRYIAYTGYFAGLETSQTIDRTRMSKKGNRDLRRAYFQIAAPIVWFDRGQNPYKRLYERKMAEGRPWYKAMPFVCSALARHVYHCLKFEEPYDIKKAFNGSSFPPARGQAEIDLEANLEGSFQVMEAHSS